MTPTINRPHFRLSTAALAILLCLTVLMREWVLAAEAGASSTPTAPAAVPAYRQANKVAILTVHGIIDEITLLSLERRIKQAVTEGADAVVLEINTDGGELPATLDICNLLKDRSETPANVVAWIRPKAYSAGTIIALACREIIVAPGSTFGDAAPIAIGPFGIQSLSKAERAKIEAPLLADLIDSARRNHYDENLVQAFARLSNGLWMLEHTQTGERVFVDLEEYRAVFGTDPPQLTGSPGPLTSSPGASRPRPWIDQSMPRPSDVAGLTPEEIQRQRELQQSLPPTRQPLTAADRGQWKLVRQVVDSNSLLTLKSDEAVYYGLAAAVVANDAEVKDFFGAQEIVRYDQSWSESLVRFLVSLPVRAILIVIFLVALFIELAMPGFGVFGATAAVALLILVGAPALAGMAQWWDILLIVLGLLLIITELFVLPGIGVGGVGGVLCLLVGLVGTFVSGDISSAVGKAELWTGLLATLTSVFVAGIAIWIISRQIHSFPFLNRIILSTELKGDSSSSAAAMTEHGLLEAMGSTTPALAPGDLGVAETDLRPAGKGRFSDRLLDVKSVGSYIDRGTPIRIVTVGRFVIEVEEADA